MIFKGLKLRVLLLLMGILFSALFFQYMVIDSDVMIENFKYSYSTSKSHVESAAKDARKRSNAAVKKQNKAAQKQNKKNKKKNKNWSYQRGQNTSSYSDTNDDCKCIDEAPPDEGRASARFRELNPHSE